MRPVIRHGLVGTLVLLVLLVFLARFTRPEQKTAFSPSFLDHVARNSPKGKGPCYVDAVQRHWTSQGDVYQAARQVREPRGQTDEVNFAIRALRAECE
jgi:hypothetical protein